MRSLRERKFKTFNEDSSEDANQKYYSESEQEDF